ncbi:hypothetical protein [Actinophytocola algeriensis]|uniref:Uncharacterized protein n=1 Tax=Actinophytocola algeriensis TaxID=1768010 RepID=A0A7W7QCG3_9PSEU|nr:hypothetical protein [Actinophytocola algeriensis]MBB4910953.1 hypothetical protein [Actinophytocola algeriensis]MBE1473946.1 hypothetical protein [Actinophytocola algeriensis]
MAEQPSAPSLDLDEAPEARGPDRGCDPEPDGDQSAARCPRLAALLG